MTVAYEKIRTGMKRDFDETNSQTCGFRKLEYPQQFWYLETVWPGRSRHANKCRVEFSATCVLHAMRLNLRDSEDRTKL